MTWFGEEKQEQHSFGLKARQRWIQLTEGARAVAKIPPDDVMLAVRWPMSGWQVWRRVDREWCEYVCDASSKDDAMQLAVQEASERLKTP